MALRGQVIDRLMADMGVEEYRDHANSGSNVDQGIECSDPEGTK